ncbi:MAG TPA: VOC family protein [Candidatus Saccharimonadales bacterium]|nr:VOC family protein [Candidatus Saccharimonadales bacterium]
MKLKSISGAVYYVQDLQKTAAFYDKLGFRAGKQEGNTVTVYVNWFWLEFHGQGSDVKTNKESGAFIYISVDSVDELQSTLVAKGITPATDPTQSAMGRKELLVVDPDGHKLVFFEKV